MNANNRPADTLNIALAQLNPVVGDVAGNADKVRRARGEAAAAGADLVAFPELFIAGYPPEDLVLKPAFQAACRSAPGLPAWAANLRSRRAFSSNRLCFDSGSSAAAGSTSPRRSQPGSRR